ncbi:MAG: hypothetical protein PF636_04260 [Actinomycetota bacterium]|nr:hypothetical protein [Actinomycetota bacterium]
MRNHADIEVALDRDLDVAVAGLADVDAMARVALVEEVVKAVV